ncbi:MAG: hypothetical protein KGZ83_09610 [Sulfuricella sp.]|nr:hypothetical protein [Sulfuricella sp.]
MSDKNAAKTASAKGGEAKGKTNWIVVLLIVLISGVLAAFYGINEYAKDTGNVIKSANNNHTRFEAIFGDLKEARYRALNLAAATLLQSRVTLDAFAKDDRANLVARTEPFFEMLKKTHGIEQLNFWTAPAKMYYRAGKPGEFGMDLSNFRKSIVAANERRSGITAVETGLGGAVALRAITPVTVDDKFIGVIEFVSNFNIPLERASDTSGLKWAVSLNKATSERVERPVDAKNDAWQGDDVYFLFSEPAIGQVLRAIKFDPRSKDHALVSTDGKTYYVKAFPIVNFSGVPTITVATLLDVSKPFAEASRAAAIKGAILFLLAAILGSVGFIKFGQIKDSLGGALSRQKKELEERTASCDAALAKLREVDVIKRGFFTNLVTAVNEPLQSVAGQLKALPSSLEDSGAAPEVVERLQFALSETQRLSLLVQDYQQIEMFRQKLVKGDCPVVSLSGVAAKTLEEDLALYRRLPQLEIAMMIPTDLPQTRADADLLRRAIAGLTIFAVQRSGRGRIVLGGSQDQEKWLVLSVTGSAFSGDAAPSEALLDESRQFMARLASGASPSANGGPLVGVVLARIIIEFFGGSLNVSGEKDAPGFIVRLPAVA